MSHVRWGVLGAGRIARTFCQDIRFASNAQLTAIGSRHAARASTFATDFVIPHSFGSYAELCQSNAVDAIYVATPHNFHFEHCLLALEHGKHVLCEKPITDSPEQCERLFTLASQQQCFLMEAMWTLFLPAIQTAKSWLDAGRIGELLHIKADFGYPIEFDAEGRHYNPALAGGCVLDMGIYPLALALYMAGQLPDSWTVNAHIADTGVEDDVVMLGQCAGVSLQLATSFRTRLPNTAYLIGSKGYIRIDDFFCAHECVLCVVDEETDKFVDRRQGSGFEFEIETASQHILRQQHQSDVMTAAFSLHLQQQMDGIRALCNLQRQ
ncbi:Gfo/Idh/MocA family protein [Aestuariibacter salexigens]|uniref:Gfo/Idh/MocA family protein n=1 Tax=Aestuariibacter salexigens TaxID=226010 RepID=UPI000423CF3D|nr:Gfo/Idh/MocA family oxidoreductase [Aestuariibacter salexigens]